MRRKEVDVYGAARARRLSGRRAARKGWKRVRERTCRTRSRVSGVCADEEEEEEEGGGVGRRALLRLKMGGGAEAMRWVGREEGLYNIYWRKSEAVLTGDLPFSSDVVFFFFF